MSDIPIIPNELTDTEINYLEEIETMNEDTTIVDEYMTEIEELLREDEEIDYT